MMKKMSRCSLPALVIVAIVAAWTSPGFAQEDPSPSLIVSASANGEGEATVDPESPLILIVEVMHAGLAEDTVAPITLSAGGGPWSDAVHLSVTDSQSNPVSWPFHPAYVPEGSLTVDADSGGVLAWWLTPEEMALIAPGVYQITATLDSAAVQPVSAVNPAASSVPVAVTVGSGATGRTAPRQAGSSAAADPMLLTEYHMLRGEDSTALAVIDGMLAGDPTNVGGLGYRGEVLEALGRPKEALAAYGAAVTAYYSGVIDSVEPPFPLLREYYGLQNAIEAQKTFDVTVAVKTPGHPYFGSGYADGFFLDGVPGAELWLLRDSTYTFRMSGVPPGTPFYLTADSAGAGVAPYTDGVTGAPASGNEIVTITPGAGAPPTLYYQSTTQPMMGWRLHIVHDSVFTGVENPPANLPGEYELSLAYPNPFNPETRFTLTLKRQQHVTITVYDSRGRQVSKLFDGQLPGSVAREFTVGGGGLASGAYIVRIQGEHFSAVRRIVLLK